ncbi:hypothetical protein HMPREF9711_02015 [Myroides odoratimimus CCUG 3837]|uniref:hypothetical protein n=1 Tax=Myroides odoratimimus TaxID=76832 RepID=UPI000280ACA8|nr:hypothetical protein [Myroides odoratimimus]EKB04163.1 hypothetical protein HMPREF9711_02015 [Myroides odoratimimus CCUG 3837]
MRPITTVLLSFKLYVTCVVTLLGGVLTSMGQEILEDYSNFLALEKVKLSSGEIRLYKTIKEVDSTVKGAEYINKHRLFWDYLVVNFSESLEKNTFASNKEITLSQDGFLSMMKADSIFSPLVEKYSSQVIKKNSEKDTISMDEVLNVAVKFFNIDKITPNGEYSARICTGINDIKDTEIKRKPFIEAFAFYAVRKNLRNEKYDVYNYFIDSIKGIYKLNLGIDKEERLLRAQGALFIQMLQSDKLKELLEDEYNLNKEVLPFVLSS